MADVAEEYRSSLSELSYNSKPHINMLTMIAEENIKEASAIVQTIVDHINSVQPEMKLPAMYLVDSIIKNIGKVYIQLFSKTIVPLFTSVFEKVDENVRSLLYKLRATWTGIFPNALLLRLDRSVISLDPAWPILAQVPPTNIHVNPKFLDKPSSQLPKKEETVPKRQSSLLQEADEIKKKQLEVLKVLQAKKQQLLELKRKAASATAASEYVGVETQKNNNVRDPRLSKKVCTSDATTLQSVVVVPKSSHAVVHKRKDDASKDVEKHSMSPERKRRKLDTDDSESQRDMDKSKDTQDNAKFNNDQNHNDKNSHMNENKVHTVNNRNNKNKKHASNLDNSIAPHLRDKDAEMPPTNFESKVDSDNLLKRTNVMQNISNQSIKKMNSFSHFSSDKEIKTSEENNEEFKQQFIMNVKDEALYKNNCRVEPPPPPPPLLFGSEDKDYRTLVPAKKLDSDERILSDPAYAKCLSGPVVKSFKLDNKERKVYFVNDRSFAVMDDNIPRELTFEGPPRLVFVEGLPKPFELHFGGHQVRFEIDGKWNNIRFGTPAQEIFINHSPYEAQFGGAPFTACLENGKMHRIRISGPPPQVILGKAPAYDLYEVFCRNNKEFLSRFDSQPVISHDVTSKTPSAAHDVDMRVNKFSSTYFNFPVEKVNDVDWQRMPLGDSQKSDWNVPKNSFETSKDVVSQRNSSEEPADWNRSMPVSDLSIPPPLPPKQMINRPPPIPPDLASRYALPLPASDGPNSVSTGNNMSLSQPEYSKPTDFSSNPQFNKVQFSNTPRLTPPPLPPFLNSIPNTSGMSASFPSASVTTPIPVSNLSVPVQVASLTPSIPVTTLTVPSQMPPLSGPVPMTVMSLPMQMPSLSGPTQMSNISGPMQLPSLSSLTQTPILSGAVQPTSSSAISTAVSNSTVNVDVFLEKLVAAGIIGKKSGTSTPTSMATTSTESDKNVEVKKEEIKEEIPEDEPIPEIIFESKCLKKHYPGVINALHNGSQCATCGMRFKEIQSEQYSHHLDWHFRMNRREKDGAKKPFSRRLYYEIKDWIEFKEFEEVDERAPSYFELQASGEQSESTEVENVYSVPSTECESETCAVCGEQFQLFWVEEEEEWHLRNAVKHDGQVYHPACYEDYKKANESLNTDLDTSMEEMSVCIKTEPEEVEDQVNVPNETVEGEEKEIKEELIETEAITEMSEDPVETETSEIQETKIQANETQATEMQPNETQATEIQPNEIQPNEIQATEIQATEIQVTEEEDSTKSTENEKTVQDEKSETDSVKLQETVDDRPVKSEDTDTQSKPPSPSKNVPSKSEDEEEEIEFRPPTPDPRFQVLEPVTRGTELSALCLIM